MTINCWTSEDCLLVWSSLKEHRQCFLLAPHLPTIICKSLLEQLLPLLLTFPFSINTLKSPNLDAAKSSSPNALLRREVRPRWFSLRNVQVLASKNIPSIGGLRLTEAPGHSHSPRPPGASGAGTPGPAQTSRSPAVPSVRRSPEPSRAPGRPHSRARQSPGRRVTGTTPGPPPTPQPGQVPGLLADTHPTPTAPRPPPPPPPLASPPARSLLLRGVRAGAATPPDPPRVRTAQSPDPERRRRRRRRHRPLSFPPSSLSASLPPRPA